jgi:hypothetical protein
MKRNILPPIVISFAVLSLTTVFLAGCRKASDPVSQPTVASSPKAQTPFERDLEYVRTGQFTYMFVFSRKEGGVFTRDDIAYLKANSPQETNQWVYTDDKRRVIAGTNFEFKQEHFDALNKRFIIENLSGK